MVSDLQVKHQMSLYVNVIKIIENIVLNRRFHLDHEKKASIFIDK